MAFHDVRFRTDNVEPVGGPIFSTAINVSAGGREQAQANWSRPRGRWTFAVPHGRQDLLDYLVSFFRARMGRAHTFRFKDWSDYKMARQQIGVTTGAQSVFQLAKAYTSGPTTVTRNITKPASGTVRVWVDSVERSQGSGASNWQVDLTTGIITLGSTLTALSAKAVEASCEFDIVARFESDELALRVTRDGYGDWGEVGIVEVFE